MRRAPRTADGRSAARLAATGPATARLAVAGPGVARPGVARPAVARLTAARFAAALVTIVATAVVGGCGHPLEPVADRPLALLEPVADRPLAPLTASAGASRRGPCAAAVGVVPDSGCPGSGGGTPGRPSVGGCPVFPADNAWNTDVSTNPVHPRSAAIVAEILATGGAFVHPDFGSNPDYGIPYTVVPAGQPEVPVTYVAYGSESDPGPFPIPPGAAVEAGSDRHVLVVRQGECVLYELFNARRSAGGSGWDADSGARWDLSSNALRPEGWTSADAAGLAILPGLVRYDEAAAGAIDHALRVTFARTQAVHVLPATHHAATSSSPDAPPMGLRLRLRADFDRSGFVGQSRAVLDALARYGMIVADNGSNWFVSGATDARWDDADLEQLKTVPGTAFEVVDTGPARP